MYRQGDGLKQEHLSVSFFLFPPICSAYSNMIIQCGYAIQYLIQSILLFRSKALPTTIYLLPVVVYTIKYSTNIISHFPVFIIFSLYFYCCWPLMPARWQIWITGGLPSRWLQSLYSRTYTQYIQKRTRLVACLVTYREWWLWWFIKIICDIIRCIEEKWTQQQQHITARMVYYSGWFSNTIFSF